MRNAVDRICADFTASFDAAVADRGSERRIGAELKFPLVHPDGTAVPRAVVDALWRYLAEMGWAVERDAVSGRVVGASVAGEQNRTVASCETGYCKTEFSMAHVGTLHALRNAVSALRELLKGFADREGVRFLCFGLVPATPPSRDLLMKKVRSSVWDRVFPSNRMIAPEDGDDVHLFTINAGSHVHVSVSPSEAIAAVNVLNGFSGPQIALLADSSIWRSAVDPEHKCVAEKFWDWWRPAAGRVGVPDHRFRDIHDYIATVAALKPVYVKRDGAPLTLPDYDAFADYYGAEAPQAMTLDGEPVAVTPAPADFDLHNSCYWFNARISRYFTVENRVADQQPPADLLAPAAITLGLVSALSEAGEALAGRDWSTLREMRQWAMRHGPASGYDGAEALHELTGVMLDVAASGLRARGFGEESYLAPLQERHRRRRCPADEATEVFRDRGVHGLTESRSFTDAPR